MLLSPFRLLSYAIGGGYHLLRGLSSTLLLFGEDAGGGGDAVKGVTDHLVVVFLLVAFKAMPCAAGKGKELGQ